MEKNSLSVVLTVLFASACYCAAGAGAMISTHEAMVADSPDRLDAAPLPTNPNATEAAVKLYRYLYNLGRSKSDSGKLISGHWQGASFKRTEGHSFHIEELVEICRRTGKWVGMVDGWICPGNWGESAENDPIEDCMWYGDLIPEDILWWRNRGIVHVCASFFNPLKDRYGERYKENIPGDVDQILAPGTNENRRWRALCDRMAEFFKALEKQDVPLIFRPFTEAYIPNYWYSPSKVGKENARRLYRDLYDYLTRVKGCNNVLWDFQGSKDSGHFPGEGYVDVFSARSEYRAWKVEPFQGLDDRHMPWGNGELGDYGKSRRTLHAGKEEIPWHIWLKTIRKRYPGMTFYTIWRKNYGPVKAETAPGVYGNYDEEYNQLIADPYILTRDELSVGPVPPGLPVRNEFAASAAITDWIPVRGRWAVKNGNLQRTDGGEPGIILFGNTDWTDYHVSARVRMPGDCDGNGKVGIIGRAASVQICYCLTVDAKALELWRCINGDRTLLASWSHEFKAGQGYELKLDMTGDTLCGGVDVNDGGGLLERIRVQDSIIPCGCIGVYSETALAEIERVEAVGRSTGVGAKRMSGE